jgi:hypothetical protein
MKCFFFFRFFFVFIIRYIFHICESQMATYVLFFYINFTLYISYSLKFTKNICTAVNVSYFMYYILCIIFYAEIYYHAA